MGVPSFFKWLAKRYPKTVQDATEQQQEDQQKAESNDNGASAGASSSGGNGVDADRNGSSSSGVWQPVGENPAIDNLYLDMNGIIHPCCHPEEGGSFTEEQMLLRIWAYVQRVVGIARPRRVLYLAIDGVAPRAKMNQQRSRRFRAAREAQQKAEVHAKLKAEWKARGLELPSHMRGDHSEEAEWDSNVITPGTPFMAKVSAALHFHVEWALQHDPSWRHLTVIFSDATVPGEGEHKIIHWIRLQRATGSPHYDPNARHCLYGMDADLIMLGLATHLSHFYIIRESLGDLTPSAVNVRCGVCGEKGHYSDRCEGAKWTRKEEPAKTEGDAADPIQAGLAEAAAAAEAQRAALIPETKSNVSSFQFLHLPILREYLMRELSLPQAARDAMTFPYDFEAALDDFLLLAMFVGNDFLPHLPSLEIKEGAIEMLLKAYKELLPTLDGYLTTEGVVSLPRLARLLEIVGQKENEIFARRRSKAQFHKRKDDEHKRKIHAIRKDNARREAEQNKFAPGAAAAAALAASCYPGNVPGASPSPSPSPSSSSPSASPSSSPPVPMAQSTPAPAPTPAPSQGIKPFIHPSRQTSAPLHGANPSHMHAPPPTPATPASDPSAAAPAPASTPIPAPKANMSAAALLRERLKAGKNAPAASAAAAAVGTGSMDTSSLPAGGPALTKQVSDPIPNATAALSAMSTSDGGDDTPQKANLRAAQLLKQTLLGKRKETSKTEAPAGGAAPVAAEVPAASTTADAATADGSTTTATTAAEPAEPVPAPATSPILEIPLKKSKLDGESAPSSAVPSRSPTPAVATTAAPTESAAGEPAAAAVDPVAAPSFDPQEKDQYGNLISSMSFEQHFENQWQQLNEPAGVEDPVQFGTDGWKERYYTHKLHFSLAAARADPISDDARTAERLFRTYLEGLCWVMRYYHSGCTSWGWFFPFHYAPLAEDLATFLREGHMREGAQFTLGQPFEPVGQLMAVLPARSNHCVPRAVRVLMTDSPESPICDFYPKDFELDLNGKKFMWQAVALLPFIDEQRLLAELSRVRPTFTAEEAERNRLGCEYIFMRADTPAGAQISAQVYERNLATAAGGVGALRRMGESELASIAPVELDTAASHGLAGSVRPYPSASVPALSSVLVSPEQPRPIQRLQVVSAAYALPPERPHTSALLPGSEPFVPRLREEDFRTLVEPRQYQPRNNYRGHRHHQNNNNNNNNNSNESQSNGGQGQGQRNQQQQQQQSNFQSRGSVRTSDWREREAMRAERRAYAVMSQIGQIRPFQVRAIDGASAAAFQPGVAPPHQFVPHGGAAWQQQQAGAPLMPMHPGMYAPQMGMAGGYPGAPAPMAGGLSMPPHPGMYAPQQAQMHPQQLQQQGMYPGPPPAHLYGAMAPPQGYYAGPPQGGFYPQMPMPGMGMGMPMGGMGYPAPGPYDAAPAALPAPYASPAVQTFLAAPPPPGKPPGWIPPPVHTIVPGFPMPTPPPPPAAQQ